MGSGHVWLPAVDAPYLVHVAPKAANAFQPDLVGRYVGRQITAIPAQIMVTCKLFRSQAIEKGIQQ